MGSFQLCDSFSLLQKSTKCFDEVCLTVIMGSEIFFYVFFFPNIQVSVTNEERRRGSGRRGGSSHLLHTRLPDYTLYFTVSFAKPGCQHGEQPTLWQEVLCQLNKLKWLMCSKGWGVKNWEAAENNHCVCGAVQEFHAGNGVMGNRFQAWKTLISVTLTHRNIVSWRLQKGYLQSEPSWI